MSQNGKHSPRRPRIEIQQSTASPEEAAAVTAAIEQFLRDTAPTPEPAGPATSPWLEAGLLEGTGRDPARGTPWGSLATGTSRVG